MPYFLFFLTIISLSFFAFVGDKRLKIASALFATLIAVLFAGVRDGVGVDDLGYKYYFDSVEPLFSILMGESGYSSEPRPYEPGFYYLMVVSKSISSSFVFFKILVSFIIVSCVLRSYCLLTKNYSFAFFMFFALLFVDIVFHQFRNGLAMGFFLLAVGNYANGRYVYFSFWSLIAVTFHLTALFIFLIPFLAFFGFNVISVFAVLSISYILKELNFFLYVVDLVFSSGNADATLVESKLYGKLQNPKYMDKKIEFGLGAAKSVIIIVSLLIREKVFSLSNRELLMAKSYVFGFSVFMVLSDYGIFASRVFRYFVMLEPLLVLSVLVVVRDKFFVFFVFVFYFLVHLLLNFGKFSGFPYKSIV